MPDPNNADVLAYQAIRRLDAGEHDLEPERAAALRETLEEVRVRLSNVDARSGDLRRAAVMVLLSAVIIAIGPAVNLFVDGSWYVRMAVAAGIVAVLAPIVRWLLHLRARAPWRREWRQPPAPSTADGRPLAELAHALPDAVRARIAGVRKGRRPYAEHVEMCAVRAWSLANGGPLTAAAPLLSLRGKRARALSGRVDWLTHRAYEDLRLAHGDLSHVRHRLARQENASRLLQTEPVPADWGTTALAALAVAALAATFVVAPGSIVYGFGPMLGTMFGGWPRRGTCTFQIVPKGTLPAVTGTRVEIRRDIAEEIAALPADHPAVPSLRAAYALLGEANAGVRGEEAAARA